LPEPKKSGKTNAKGSDAGNKVTVPASQQTVLVVETNGILNLCLATLIETAGLNVVQAGDVVEALAILERNADVALMVTNVVMRDSMDGVELAWLVNKRWPNVKIVVVSGKPGLSESDLPTKCLFLTKPYHESELMFEIRALVGV
jgi:two-component system, response regulator PdtaR